MYCQVKLLDRFGAKTQIICKFKIYPQIITTYPQFYPHKYYIITNQIKYKIYTITA